MIEKVEKLRLKIKKLYDDNNESLLFHGLHHIEFVAKKTVVFADSIGADVLISETSALVHDLNYIVEVNSEPQVGSGLRSSILTEAGYSSQEIERIEEIIIEAHLGTRGNDISKEGMSLSDADTLFKALPITPILFASRYITQNKVDISKLADKVVSEQQPLFDEDIYFYTELAKSKYLNWAKGNLVLWKNVQESIKDKDVQDLISMAYDRGVL